MKQKNEFLRFVCVEYNKMAKTDPNAKITDMTREICDKYLAQVMDEVEAKDDEIEDVPDKLELIELGPDLPETAKPNLKEFIYKKLDEINEM